MLSQLFSDKTLLIVLTFVGMAMCTAGIGYVAEQNLWLHPMAILGYILGATILVVVGAGLFEVRLPLVDSPRAALIALVVLAVAKIALTQLHRALS